MDFKQKIALLMVLASVQLPCASQAAEEDRELAQIAAEQRRSGQDEQIGEINSALTDSLSTKPTQETDREVRERKRKLKQTRKEKEKTNERRLRESANQKPTPKPETITIAPNEPEVTPAPRPVVRPRPVVQPMTPPQPVAQPTTPPQPMAQPTPPPQPVAQPTTPPQPVAQPTTPPQPVAQPTTPQPVAQPTTPPQPVAQPTTPPQPVAQPTPPPQPMAQPTPQPVAQPTPQPVAQPTTPTPVAQPTPSQRVTQPTPTPQQDLLPTPKPVETLNLPNQKVVYANFVEVAKAVNFIPLYMSRKSGYDITAMYAGQGIVEIRYGRRWEPTVSLAVRTYKRAAGEEPQDISGVTGVKWRVDTTTGTTIYIAKISDSQQVAAWAVGQYTFSAQAENLSFATFHSLVADELVELSTHYYLDI